MNKESLATTTLLIKSLLPSFKEFLSDVDAGHGFFNFPSPLIELFLKDGLPPWATYYEDPRKIKSLGTHTLIGHENISELRELFNSLSSQEQIEVKNNLNQTVLELDLLGDSPEDIDNLLEEETHKPKASKTEDEESVGLQQLYLGMYSFITTMSYALALMSFGKSMCDLVKDAKKGDEDAFCNAVQVDKTVLTGIPFFQKRLIKAQLGSEPEFLHKLSLAIRGPSLGKKLSFPLLMFVFALLDDEGFLEMPLNDLMAVCEDIGVYGREFGIEDTESLRKRRKYYREQTGRQIKI